MNEKPQWERYDSLKSIRDFGRLILEWIDRKDTELADAVNDPNDELESTTN